jgi:hypothetical protein
VFSITVTAGGSPVNRDPAVSESKINIDNFPKGNLMIKKRIAALAVGASIATSALLAPQAVAAPPTTPTCEKHEEWAPGANYVGELVPLNLPAAHTSVTDVTVIDGEDVVVPAPGKTLRILPGTEGKHTIKVSYRYKEQGSPVFKTGYKTLTINVGHCKEKGKDYEPHESSFDRDTLRGSSLR